MDWSRLRTLGALDGPTGSSDVTDLVELFRKSAVERVAALAAEAAAANWQECAAIAHALRGSSASFGAVHLARVAGEVEHACDDGDPSVDGGLAIDAVRSALEDLLVALESLPSDLL